MDRRHVDSSSGISRCISEVVISSLLKTASPNTLESTTTRIDIVCKRYEMY